MKLIIIFLFCFYSISSFSQNRAFITTTAGKLYSVDIVNCTATEKGILTDTIPSIFNGFVGTIDYFIDIAFTTDGKLWGIAPYGEVCMIDTSTAELTFMFDTNLLSNGLEGYDDSTLLAVSYSYSGYSSEMYTINLNTGSVNSIGVIGAYPSGDFTWYDNSVYLNSNSLIRIDLDVSSGTTPVVTDVSSRYYEGLGGYGLAVSQFPDHPNVLCAFDGNDIYEVCHLDGSTNLYCDSFLPENESVFGAASVRLPVQNPTPVYCKSVVSLDFEEIRHVVNPWEKVITVYSGTEFQNISVCLYDVAGQIICNFSGISGKEFSFSYNTVGYGMYFLSLENGNSLSSKKLILD